MINKIAAGEVIERPASVIKELVENSLDAGASRIDVSVENGGADLIRIADNGCGIEPDQLKLAVSPHATSKLADAEDLFRVQTFGFRGEALASVAEISQFTLKSRTAGNTDGAVIHSNGGEHSEMTPCGLPIGTQIEVKNLFFNTPVRRRYMKSAATEFGHISETFVRLVLPHPSIHFTLKHNGRTLHELPPTSDPVSRIRQLFGEEAAKDLIPVESPPSAAVKVSGFVSHPNQSRPNNRMQYFFLNHRFIRDRSLQHALNEAYRGLLLGNRFPLAFLQIELPPDMFDVNVHPTKMEVRFLDTNRVYSGFLSAIREKFLTSDLRGKFTSGGQASPATDISPDDPRKALDDSAAVKTRAAADDWLAKLPAQVSPQDQDSTNRPFRPPLNTSFRDNLSIHRLPVRPDIFRSRTQDGDGSGISPPDPVPVYRGEVSDRAAFSPKGNLIVQMLNRYLVMETETGIAMIDQHALHERILYEKLKSALDTCRQTADTVPPRLESQRILVPVPADLAPNELSCVLENIPFFQTLGLTVEPFGGSTVLISAIPAMLANIPPMEILLSLVEPILSAGKKLEPAELLEEMLHSMACKAAVKAGDKISSESMRELVALAEKEINSHHCPHGRPSTLVFSREEIDKMFRRI
jgi:DNA mismatch repair protein MutL